MKLVFIYGMPGAGKLTITKELAKITNYTIFHNHLTVDFVTSIFEFGSKPFVYLREKIWTETFKLGVESGLDGMIFTFVFEKTVTQDFINNVEKVMKDKGELCFVELICDKKELDKRVVSSSRKKFGKFYTVEKLNKFIDKHKSCFVDIKRERLIIDNSNLSAVEVAKQIKEHYKL